MDMRLLIPILGILMVMIPVAGVTLILTARFALKPLAETLAKALRESGFAAGGDSSEALQDLTEQVHLLSDQVSRLQQAQDFDRALLAEKAQGQPAAAPGEAMRE